MRILAMIFWVLLWTIVGAVLSYCALALGLWLWITIEDAIEDEKGGRR